MRIFAVVVAALTVGVLAAVARADDPNQAYAERVLKAAMTKTFAKQAPGLKITKVTCPAPKAVGQTTFTCVATFTVAQNHERGTYRVKQTIAGSKAKWSTTGAPSCTDTRTGKKIVC